MPVSILTIELTEFVLRVGKAKAKGRGFHFESLEEIPLSEGERIEEVLAALQEAGAEAVAVSVQPTNKMVRFVTLDQLSGMETEADLRAFLQEESGIHEKAIMAAVDAERGKPYSFDGVKELNALTALFPEKNIRNAKAFLTEFGLTPTVLQPATLLHFGSLLQYLNFQKENEPVLMLEIGEEFSHVAFVSVYGVTNAVPISTGLQEMLAAIQKELSLDSLDTALQLFSTGGEELLEIEQTVLKNFLDALNPLFELFETQTGIMPSYVVTTGLPERYSWLEKAISRETNIKPLEFDFPGWLKSLEITAEGTFEDLLQSRSSLALFHLLRAHRSGKPEFMWQLDFNRYLGEQASAESKEADPSVERKEKEEPPESAESQAPEPAESAQPKAPTASSEKEGRKGSLKLKPGGGKKEGTKPSLKSAPKKTGSSGLSLSDKKPAETEEKDPPSPPKKERVASVGGGQKPKPEEKGKERKDSAPKEEDRPSTSSVQEEPKKEKPEPVKGKPRPDPAERKETFAPPPEIAGKKQSSSSDAKESDTKAKEEGKDTDEKPRKRGTLVKVLLVLLVLGALGGGYFWWQSDRHLVGLPALSANPEWQAVSPERAKTPGLAWIRPEEESILLTAYPVGLSGEVLDRSFLTYREYEGNFSILGNFEELTEGARGGLLARSRATGAPSVFLYRQGNEVILRARTDDGGVEEMARVEAQGQNLWLRLDRRGSGIVGFVSFDAEDWERIGRASVGSETLKAGWALVPDSGEPESLFRVSRVRAGAF
ncbi:MAG: hypothetical protein LAT55_04160 [Opitutales bacterium]|nr:hypothetical protein [Opitutales bacterium]